MSKKATAFMQAYAWPGNIRKLENLLECAVL
ncbi:AAA-type ATPase lid domain-containing protein [Acinetobacter radioresistens]